MYTLHQWNEEGHQYEGQNTSGATWEKKTNKQTNHFSPWMKNKANQRISFACVYMAQTTPLSTVSRLGNQVFQAGVSLLFWGWWSHTGTHPGFLVPTATTQRYFSLKGNVMANL